MSQHSRDGFGSPSPGGSQQQQQQPQRGGGPHRKDSFPPRPSPLNLPLHHGQQQQQQQQQYNFSPRMPGHSGHYSPHSAGSGRISQSHFQQQQQYPPHSHSQHPQQYSHSHSHPHSQQQYPHSQPQPQHYPHSQPQQYLHSQQNLPQYPHAQPPPPPPLLYNQSPIPKTTSENSPATPSSATGRRNLQQQHAFNFAQQLPSPTTAPDLFADSPILQSVKINVDKTSSPNFIRYYDYLVLCQVPLADYAKHVFAAVMDDETRDLISKMTQKYEEAKGYCFAENDSFKSCEQAKLQTEQKTVEYSVSKSSLDLWKTIN